MLATEPDIYCPTVNEEGKYCDYIGTFKFNSMKCPCTFDHTYKTKTAFNQHCKTQRHTRWLNNLNVQHKNFYQEMVKANEIVKQQREMLIIRENEIQVLRLKLEAALRNRCAHAEVANLLDLTDYD